MKGRRGAVSCCTLLRFDRCAPPAGLGHLLIRQNYVPARSGLDDRPIVFGGDAVTQLPSGDSAVRLAKISSQFSHGFPDVRDVFHIAMLRNLRSVVNTQIAECYHRRLDVKSRDHERPFNDHTD